jgi:hypothetical protein
MAFRQVCFDAISRLKNSILVTPIVRQRKRHRLIEQWLRPDAGILVRFGSPSDGLHIEISRESLRSRAD